MYLKQGKCALFIYAFNRKYLTNLSGSPVLASESAIRLTAFRQYQQCHKNSPLVGTISGTETSTVSLLPETVHAAVHARNAARKPAAYPKRTLRRRLFSGGKFRRLRRLMRGGSLSVLVELRECTSRNGQARMPTSATTAAEKTRVAGFSGGLVLPLASVSVRVGYCGRLPGVRLNMGLASFRN